MPAWIKDAVRCAEVTHIWTLVMLVVSWVVFDDLSLSVKLLVAFFLGLQSVRSAHRLRCQLWPPEEFIKPAD